MEIVGWVEAGGWVGVDTHPPVPNHPPTHLLPLTHPPAKIPFYTVSTHTHDLIPRFDDEKFPTFVEVGTNGEKKVFSQQKKGWLWGILGSQKKTPDKCYPHVSKQNTVLKVLGIHFGTDDQ